MGSTDLLTSAKGPGLLGMLLAIFVLIGFGALFMLALDEGGPNKKSLAARIRDADKRIASQTAMIADGEKILASIPALKRTSSELLEAGARRDFLRARIGQRNSEVRELETGIQGLHEEFSDYKNRYRAFVRNEATGTKMEELKTLSGETFSDVEIRKVTAVGLEIRHRHGHKRIGFADLDEEMQDHYQFNEEQKLAELQREAKVRKRRNRAVAIANKAADRRAAERREIERKEEREKSIAEIAAKEARLVAVTQEIQQLQSELAGSERSARSAREAGRMHLSKSNGINNRIKRKRSEHSRIQTEIASLRAAL